MIGPKVTTIATTQFRPMVARDLTGWMADETANIQNAEALIEFAGRGCYESWNRPNPATATNHGYLRHILEVNHPSLFRHASVTFYIQGVSRSFSHQMVTHKHIAQSERSQRYIPADDFLMVMPPAVLENDQETIAILEALGNAARSAYTRLVDRFTLQGQSHKKAREAARAVMPNMTETRLTVTGNLQAWRQFIAVRATEHADAEMCLVAVMIAWELKMLYPNLFQDMHLRVGKDGGRDTIYFGVHEDDIPVAGDGTGV